MKILAITLITIACVILAMFIICGAFAFYAYRKVWMTRTHETNDPVKIQFNDIEKYSERVQINFKFERKVLDLDTELRGFVYSPKDKSNMRKPLVVMATGWGRSHLSYLLDIGILNKAGYQVIAYDQFGTGASGGRSQRGMHYGMYSLDFVLKQLEKSEAFKDRPIYLYGHSWGGYCVLSVLDKHKEVKKVVARSPVGRPVLSSFCFGGNKVGMPLAKFLYFCARLPLVLRYGPKVFKKSQSAVRKNDTSKILITSCTEDPTVHKEASPIPYLLKHPQDNVQIYIRDDLHIHNDILSEEGYEYFKDKLAEYHKISNDKSVGYVEHMKDFIDSLDRSKITTDEKEIGLILDFLDD